jgi:ligand-binding SRPBCC domain-containing protein
MAHTLTARMWLPLPIEPVFAFFCNVKNLDAITPPGVHFRVMTPAPIVLGVGALIDYRLRIRGIPIRWQSEITVWDPPVQFVDEQRRGPYRRWRHCHDFEAHAGGTWVRDHVEYLARGWVCEPVLNRLLVAPDLRTIFAYRQKRIRDLLAPQSQAEEDRIETS